MRLEDIPAGKLRTAAVAALAADLAAAESRAAQRPARATPACHQPARADRYRCHTCGATSSAWAPIERHADTHGGARIELAL